MVVLDDTESLVKKFGEESLSEQLGGSLVPNIDSFIQQRVVRVRKAKCCQTLERNNSFVTLHFWDLFTCVKNQWLPYLGFM